MERNKTKNLITMALIAAIIIVMTVLPIGYISISAIEITTLHIVVITAAMLLGWIDGGIIGCVWGITCLIRAIPFAASTEAFKPFLNPIVSVLPRIAVGIVAGLVFTGLRKAKANVWVASIITAIAGTLTNTVLVLSAYGYFAGQSIIDWFKGIVITVASLNGSIEIALAVVLVPVLYRSLAKANKN